MLPPKSENFLRDTLSYVRFTYDRNDIYQELKAHLAERMDDYKEQKYNDEEAEELALKDIGDAKEIGLELNKQHNPLLGWSWMLTNVMIGILIILNAFILGVSYLQPFFSSVNNIDAADIVYDIEVDKKVQLDDTVLHFTQVIYEKDKEMNIFYEAYDKRLWGGGWTHATIGTISDNLGNEYFDGSGRQINGIKTVGRRTVTNFPEEADTLIIHYDEYNRRYKVEIPLKAGERD